MIGFEMRNQRFGTYPRSGRADFERFEQEFANLGKIERGHNPCGTPPTAKSIQRTEGVIPIKFIIACVAVVIS